MLKKFLINMLVEGLVVLPPICLTLVAFYFLSRYLLNPDIDTIRFTPYIFAIIVSFGSLIFNWSRALDAQKHKMAIENLTRAGGYCVIAALLFSISAGIKFWMVDMKQKPGDNLFFLIVECLTCAVAAIYFISCLSKTLGTYIKRISWLSRHYNE